MTLPDIDLVPHFAQSGPQPFKGRHATMPWSGTIPISKENIDATWSSLTGSPVTPRKRLAYIHVPFCSTRCLFCGFYQNHYEQQSSERYVEYLLREIELEAVRPLHQTAPVHAVYLGGGTPSALEAKDLERIITGLRRALPLAADCEITVEGRVLNFDDERIDACINAGANRFSIGIQTFNSEIRKRMGRTSTGSHAARFIEGLCRRQSVTVVCDLLFGLPMQNATSLATDLSVARDIGLDGIDLYALNLFPNTPLGKAVSAGDLSVPDATQCRDLYLQGCEYFEQLGWCQISNCHWAGSTRERNLYNLLIKAGADCLAFGPGAGGVLNGHTWMEERNIENYYHAIDAGRKPIMMMTRAKDSNPQWRQALQGGVETGRVSLDKITPHAAAIVPLLKQWCDVGLVKDDSTRVCLTNEGRFWASNILQSFEEIISQLSSGQITTSEARERELWAL